VFENFAGVQYRVGANLGRRTRAQQSAHTTGDGIELKLQQLGDLASLCSEHTAPAAVDRNGQFAAKAAYAVMDRLEQHTDCYAAAITEIPAQFAYLPLQLCKHDVHRNRVIGLCHADRIVAFGSLDAEPDELPGRSQSVHDREHCIEQEIVILRGNAVDRCLAGAQRSRVELADVQRKIVTKLCQRIASTQHAAQHGRALGRKQTGWLLTTKRCPLMTDSVEKAGGCEARTSVIQ